MLHLDFCVMLACRVLDNSFTDMHILSLQLSCVANERMELLIRSQSGHWKTVGIRFKHQHYYGTLMVNAAFVFGIFACTRIFLDTETLLNVFNNCGTKLLHCILNVIWSFLFFMQGFKKGAVLGLVIHEGAMVGASHRTNLRTRGSVILFSVRASYVKCW